MNFNPYAQGKKKQKENKDENRIQPENYLMLPNISN